MAHAAVDVDRGQGEAGLDVRQGGATSCGLAPPLQRVGAQVDLGREDAGSGHQAHRLRPTLGLVQLYVGHLGLVRVLLTRSADVLTQLDGAVLDVDGPGGGAPDVGGQEERVVRVDGFYRVVLERLQLDGDVEGPDGGQRDGGVGLTGAAHLPAVYQHVHVVVDGGDEAPVAENVFNYFYSL